MSLVVGNMFRLFLLRSYVTSDETTGGERVEEEDEETEERLRVFFRGGENFESRNHGLAWELATKIRLSPRSATASSLNEERGLFLRSSFVKRNIVFFIRPSLCQGDFGGAQRGIR